MKKIVITGVTKGIGYSLAERFISLGHTIIGCGRTEQQILELKNKFDTPHNFTVMDISCPKEVRNWAETILSIYGNPDILINNAAIMNRIAPLWKITDEEFSDILDINVKGTVNTIRYFAPAMVKENKGVIINLSSGWGRSTSPNVAPYCGTKYAIEGLTKALAQELPSNMAAIPLSPGVVNTEMLRSCWGESASQHIDPEIWAITACKKILEFGPNDNGNSLSV